MNPETLTFVLMDPPFEQSRTVTALRLIDIAIKKGINVNVFAYEGAVSLPFSKQAQHANAFHGRDVEQENHPLPKDWIGSIMKSAQEKGVKLDWVNCGLCVDERGVNEHIPECRRGSPADLVKFSQESVSTIVIGTN